MPKLTEAEGVPPAASAEGSRKSRLDALKARRREIAVQSPEVTIGSMAAQIPTAPAAIPPVRAEPAGALDRRPAGAAFAALQKLGSGGESPGSQQLQGALRKNAAKLMQLLNKTPADATGTLEGTPFTLTGVARLARLLQERAANKNGPGTRIAAMVLSLLQEGDPRQTSVHGLSAEKLRSLWQRVESTVAKAGKASVSVAAAAVSPKASWPAPQRIAPSPGAGPVRSVPERQTRTVQDRMIDNALKIMTTTPAGSEGLVPGTGFSRAGVGRVVDLLNAKATAPDPETAAAAGAALRRFAPDPGETELVHGISVRKLRTLAAMP